jgi:hypothetical protein
MASTQLSTAYGGENSKRMEDSGSRGATRLSTTYGGAGGVGRARSERTAANVADVRRSIFRQRIDYHWLPDKRIEAVLTVTLPDGHSFRFTAQADPHEIAAALAQLHPEIGGFSLGKLWKGVKKVAKGVATSKVFKMAGTALAMAAPALGPLAPMALGASAAMKASTALLAAKVHASKGNAAEANTLIQFASDATKVIDRTSAKIPNGSPKAKKGKKKKGAKSEVVSQAPARALPASAKLLDAANATSSTIYSLLLKPA